MTLPNLGRDARRYLGRQPSLCWRLCRSGVPPGRGESPDAGGVGAWGETAADLRDDNPQAGDPSDNIFTSESADTSISTFVVGIPPHHKQGHIEWPDGKTNSGVNFTTSEQAVLTGPEFRDAVAPSKPSGRVKKKNVLISSTASTTISRYCSTGWRRLKRTPRSMATRSCSPGHRREIRRETKTTRPLPPRHATT